MATARYEDFDLRIWREGDVFKAEVTKAPVGAPSKKEVIRWPFGADATASENLRLKLENAVLKGRGHRSVLASPEEKVLREFGSEVFRAVLDESQTVAMAYRMSLRKVDEDQGSGLRVKLHFEDADADLAVLPWEYMFDAAAKKGGPPYLCLHSRSPVIRFLGDPKAGGRVKTDGPLRILAMVANPRLPVANTEQPTLETATERLSIDSAWANLKDTNAVELNWVPSGRLDDLVRSLLQGPWHIFHFIGHGGTEVQLDPDRGFSSSGYVLMEDEAGNPVKVSAEELAYRFEGIRNDLRLVVLNCCESAGGSLNSVGAAFVHTGVPSVVAMQYAITNDAAARFSELFYETLAAGHSIERALTEGRRHVRDKSDVEWGIPVMFARSTSSIEFDVSPRRAGDGSPAPLSEDRKSAQAALRSLFS